MKKYRIKIVTYKTGRKVYFAEFNIHHDAVPANVDVWLGLSFMGEAHPGLNGLSDTREEALERIDKHFDGNTEEQTIEFEYIDK